MVPDSSTGWKAAMVVLHAVAIVVGLWAGLWAYSALVS